MKYFSLVSKSVSFAAFSSKKNNLSLMWWFGIAMLKNAMTVTTINIIAFEPLII